MDFCEFLTKYGLIKIWKFNVESTLKTQIDPLVLDIFKDKTWLLKSVTEKNASFT
jgi:hypothetical protein